MPLNRRLVGALMSGARMRWILCFEVFDQRSGVRQQSFQAADDKPPKRRRAIQQRHIGGVACNLAYNTLSHIDGLNAVNLEQFGKTGIDGRFCDSCAWL